MKKGAKKVESDDKEEEKKDASKWDTKKLAVGNWFSATNYFKAKSQDGDQVMTKCNGGTEVAVSMDIL